MTRVSILYPNHDDSWFDVSYYLENHMPMSTKLLERQPGFKGVTVDLGLRGAMVGSKPPYIAMCHFLFSSVEDVHDAFAPHAATLQRDILNYTDVKPVIQFNQVLAAR